MRGNFPLSRGQKMDYKTQSTVKTSFIYFIMILLTLISIVPIWLMLVNATRDNAEINAGLSLLPSTHMLRNWRVLTGRGFKIWQGFFNSAYISVFATAFGVYFSSLTAYAIHIYKFAGKKVLWTVIMVMIMLPSSMSFIGFYQFMAKIHLTDSYIPLIIPAIASSGTVLFMKQYLDSILSKELIEAARIDGAGELFIFNRIVIPVIMPAVATQCIFGFVANWNNFMTPFVLLSKMEKYTLPMLVQTLRGDIYRTEYGGIYLGIAISLVPIIVFYAFMSRYIISGLTMGSVKE